MQNPLTIQFFSYWAGLRRARIAPSVKELDYVVLRNTLPYVFILEPEANGSFVVTFCGAVASRLRSNETRGKNFSDLWAPRHRRDIKNALQLVVTKSIPLLISASAMANNKTILSFELLMLPLLNGLTDNVVCSIFSTDGVRWIKVPLAPFRLNSIRILSAELSIAEQVSAESQSDQDGPTLIVYDGFKLT